MWYSDAHTLVSGTITVAALAAGRGNNVIEMVFKNCAPFTKCISKINNTQLDNAKYIDVVMPMCNLIEYSNNYSKISWRLWRYYRDEPVWMMLVLQLIFLVIVLPLNLDKK